ncbi:NDP-sugar epimerase, includes UDP-GlcNAc-inverting 4,6-dehydratase FlaA1 and capsular polysaccharide biosynthesis protein EpsC [Anaerobranca californiensis DSM 14826]|jgi:FlaA1/EpsC-like NDP-sugar epimerase|uniref:NDP-sugar epimerase, includes UDP-GlcNAc-inverting 4,6-dehydratase FlaA1 and capsular polysaccharide biosynthesis protein EpsC n=1 Tax=Anaerobranca californiensis DSM 14826 TaxID=1120989 RepID=A0A1M6RJE0_9FIRM|nr:nucleoside-diphosphate sugar epimerase/dehydratase [Anaerobranca californiensis]SHK32544.1 NDP-sugar epimerase, includes UDP-GlcNAc-inverting 4,6-dehydratase FlaA1 and capsular polysaccharide biosynthesis protein EpsC [Anaerobranca californiensis DSM 14826]
MGEVIRVVNNRIRNFFGDVVFKLDNLSLLKRKIFLVTVDIIFIHLSLIVALYLKYGPGFSLSRLSTYLYYSTIATIVMIGSLYINNIYKSLWRFASLEELILILQGVTLGTFLIGLLSYFSPITPEFTLYIIFYLLLLFSIGGSRISYRLLRRAFHSHNRDYNSYSRVMVIGGGEAGAILIKELLHSKELNKKPVAIIDDNPCKQGCMIHKVPVVGNRTQIIPAAKNLAIDEIIIAMPSAGKKEIKEILNICKQTKCKIKTLPGIYEIVDGKVSINFVRDVEIEDLLGREPVSVDLKEISSYLKDQIVLVTGGGGSIGSELCRQIASFEPKKLIILDIYENNAYEIQQELLRKYRQKIDLEVIIASIRDKKRIEQIFRTYRPQIVFHAAAHKHVPLMEKSPTEAIENNVFGTLNVAECADKYNAKRFVLISTDKAVNPTNIMGATKRLAEMIIQTMDQKSNTEFVAVRFGNVLGSNGSVIPLFKKQIAEGGPVTVTHPEITRYFMTIPEAVQLVIQAGAMAKGGEIFVLDMGDPVKIVDLAKDLIKLSGLEPDVDIKIEFIGLRPGEKLYEELLIAEEGLQKTAHNKIFIGSPISIDEYKLKIQLESLRKFIQSEQKEVIISLMQEIVPTYKTKVV